MADYNAISYLFPVLILLATMAVLMIRDAGSKAPALMLIALWAFVLAAHGLAVGAQIIPLYPSDIVPNTLITLAVLSFALSFVFWHQMISRTLGTLDARLDITPEMERRATVSTLVRWMLAIYALLAMALMYRKAQEIIGGGNVFAQMQFLRYRLNYDEAGWGIVEYASLSVTVFSVYMLTATKGESLAARFPIILAVISALTIAVVSTQRTSLFMLLIALTFAPSRGPLPSLKVFGILGSVLITAFLGLGFIVGKVGSEDASLGEILTIGMESFLLYFLTPLSAFDSSAIWNNVAGDGGYSLRFFFSVFSRLGLYSGEIKPLVMEFTWVPLPTNVYTFAYVSIADFGGFYLLYHAIIGALLAAVFSLPRAILSVRVLQGFCYYPLFMTLYQDQFITITSTWVQTLILIGICHVVTSRRQSHHPTSGSLQFPA